MRADPLLRGVPRAPLRRGPQNGAADASRAPMADAALASAKLPRPVLIMLIAILVPISFHLGPLALTGLRLVLIVMIIPLLVGLFSGTYGRMLAVDWLVLAHFGWLTLALAVNNPDRVIQQAGSVGIEFLGGYLMGRAYIRSRADFAALARALIYSLVLMLPFTIYETLTGTPILAVMIAKLPGIGSVTPVFADPRMGLERVQGPFDHPIHFGLYASVAFPLAFVALSGVRSVLWRVLMSAIVVGSGALALSSGALLALFLQIGLILWSITFRKIAWRWWLLVGIFASAYIAIDLLSNRSPIKVFMSYATFSAHTAYWRSIIFDWGIQNVWDNPIFGLGLNDWVRPAWMVSDSMDNFWLVMAVRYGIPGFLLLATGYVIALAQIMRRDFSGDFRLLMYRRAWVFTFVGLSFTLSTVHVWGAVYAFVFFMFGAGLWLIDAREQSAEADTPETAAGAGLRYSRFAPVHRRGMS
ncbi:O-antigen ligase family protein [Thioclava sp. BHET1]|nr:O-antigen ligase family protein [Thioclava sp. BHET1]